MPLDKVHEQNNEKVKGFGGAVGLTENPAAIKWWMAPRPEQVRLLTKHEDENLPKIEDNNLHQEGGLCTQTRFKDHVSNLLEVFCDIGNPFCDKGNELLALDTRNIIDDCGK